MTDVLLDFNKQRTTPLWSNGAANPLQVRDPLLSLKPQPTAVQAAGPDYSVYKDPNARVEIQRKYIPPEWGKEETVHNYNSTADGSRVMDKSRRFVDALHTAGYTSEQWLRFPPAIKRDYLKSFGEAEFAQFNDETRAKFGTSENYVKFLQKEYGAADAKDAGDGVLETVVDVATEVLGGAGRGISSLAGLADVAQNKVGLNVDMGLIKGLDTVSKGLADAVKPEDTESTLATFNYLMDQDRIGEALDTLRKDPIAAANIVGPEIASFVVGGGGLLKGAKLGAKALQTGALLTGNSLKLFNYLKSGAQAVKAATPARVAKVGSALTAGAGASALAALQELGSFNAEQYLAGKDPSDPNYQDALDLVLFQAGLTQQGLGLIGGTVERAILGKLSGIVPESVLNRSLKEVREFLANADDTTKMRRLTNTLQRMPIVGSAMRGAGAVGREAAEEAATSGYQDLVAQNIERGGEVSASSVWDGDMKRAGKQAKYGAVVGGLVGGAVHPVAGSDGGAGQYKAAKNLVNTVDQNLNTAAQQTAEYTVNPEGVQVGREQAEQMRTIFEQEFDAGNYTNLDNYKDLTTEAMTRTAGLVDELRSGNYNAQTTLHLSQQLRARTDEVAQMVERIHAGEAASLQPDQLNTVRQGRYNQFASQFETAYKRAGFKADDALVSGVSDTIRSLVDPSQVDAVKAKLAEIESDSTFATDRNLQGVADVLRSAVEFTENGQVITVSQDTRPVNTNYEFMQLKTQLDKWKKDDNSVYIPPQVQTALRKRNATVADVDAALQEGIADIEARMNDVQETSEEGMKMAFMRSELSNMRVALASEKAAAEARRKQGGVNRQADVNARSDTEVRTLQANDAANRQDEVEKANRVALAGALKQAEGIFNQKTSTLPQDSESLNYLREATTTQDFAARLVDLSQQYAANEATALDRSTRDSIRARHDALGELMETYYRGEYVGDPLLKNKVPSAVLTHFGRDLNRARFANAVLTSIGERLGLGNSTSLARQGATVQDSVQTISKHLEGGLASGRVSNVDMNVVNAEMMPFLQNIMKKDTASQDAALNLTPTLRDWLIDSLKNHMDINMVVNYAKESNAMYHEQRKEGKIESKKTDLLFRTKEGEAPKKRLSYREALQVDHDFVQATLARVRNDDGTYSLEHGTGRPAATAGVTASSYGNTGTYYTTHRNVSSSYTSGGSDPIVRSAVDATQMMDMSAPTDTAVWDDILGSINVSERGRQILVNQRDNLPTNEQTYLAIKMQMTPRGEKGADILNEQLRARGVTGIIYPARAGSGNTVVPGNAETVSVVVFDPSVVRPAKGTDKDILPRHKAMSAKRGVYATNTQLQTDLVTRGVPHVLGKIKESLPDSDPRQTVLDAMLEMVGNETPVRFENLGAKVGGYFDLKTGAIVLNSQSSETDVDLVHELAHAYTVYALERQDALSPEQKAVVDDIIRAHETARADENIAQAFPQILDPTTGVHEFVAEMLSNPDFQSAYDSMSVHTKPQGVIANVRAFMRRLAELFGIAKPKATALRDLLHNTASIFQAYPPGTFTLDDKTGGLYRTKVHSMFFARRTQEQGTDKSFAAHAQMDENGLWGLYWDEDGERKSVEGMTEDELMAEAQRKGLVPKSRSKVTNGQKYIAETIEAADSYSGLLRNMLQGIQKTFPDVVAEPMVRGLDRFIRWAGVTQNNHYVWMTMAENQMRNMYGVEIPTDMETLINRLRQKGSTQLEQYGVDGNRTFKDHYEVLTKMAEQSGLSKEQMDDLVYAMRAPHFRRRKIRNSGMKDTYYKGRDLLADKITGFGWRDSNGKWVEDDDGSKYMARLNPTQRKFAKELESAIVEMNNNTLDFELAMGRISKETHDDLYGEFYVPLQNGQSEAQAYSGRIKGRSTKASDPLAKYIANSQARINHAVDSAIHAEFARYLQEFPVPQMAGLESVELVNRKDNVEHAYAAEGVMDGRSRSFYVNGQRMRIVVRDPVFARALSKANQLERDSMMNNFVRYAGTTTRYLAMARTVFAPTFFIKSFIRDNTQLLVNVQAASRGKVTDAEAFTIGTRALGTAYKMMPTIMKGQWDKKKADFKYRVYLTEGGINPMAQYDTDKIAQDLDRQAFGKSKARRRIIEAGHKYMDMTHATDNAARFAAWYEYLKLRHGDADFTSEQELADFLRSNPEVADIARNISKNITGNFEQKGASAKMRNFFMFWNAIMGSIKTTYHMVNPEHGTYGLKALGTLMLMGFAMAGAEDDERDEDGTPMFKHERRGGGSMCFGDYCVQISQELRPFLHAGQAMGYLLTNQMNVSEAMLHMYKGVQEGIAPFQLANSDDALFNTLYALSPTVFQPMTSMAFNKNYFGANIVPDAAYDQEGNFIPNPMDHERRNMSDSLVSQWLTKNLYDYTGIDVAPGNVDALVGHFGGQAFQTIQKLTNGMRFEGKDPVTGAFDLVESIVKPSYNDRAYEQDLATEFEALQRKLRAGESYDQLVNLTTRHQVKQLQDWYNKLGAQARQLRSSSGRTASELYTQKKQLEFQLNPPVDEILQIKSELDEVAAQRRNLYLNALQYIREQANGLK